MSPVELFAEVARVSPGFKRVAAEHLADNEELLPHPLMANLLRHIGSHFQGPDDARPSTAQVQAMLTIQELQCALKRLQPTLAKPRAAEARRWARRQ